MTGNGGYRRYDRQRALIALAEGLSAILVSCVLWLGVIVVVGLVAHLSWSAFQTGWGWWS